MVCLRAREDCHALIHFSLGLSGHAGVVDVGLISYLGFICKFAVTESSEIFERLTAVRSG
jgi:hypothetical protein